MRYLQGKYRYFVKLGQDLTDSRKWYTGLGVRHTLEVRRKISIKRDSKYASTGFICKTNCQICQHMFGDLFRYASGNLGGNS